CRYTWGNPISRQGNAKKIADRYREIGPCALEPRRLLLRPPSEPVLLIRLGHLRIREPGKHIADRGQNLVGTGLHDADAGIAKLIAVVEMENPRRDRLR